MPRQVYVRFTVKKHNLIVCIVKLLVAKQSAIWRQYNLTVKPTGGTSVHLNNGRYTSPIRADNL